MKQLIIMLSFIFLLHSATKSQDSWGFYINATNTNMINKDANYTKAAFNSIGDFSERQPFYGTFKKKSATFHKSFGVWYKIPFKNEQIKYYIVAGVATFGHKEELNGGKSEDFPYAFYQNLSAGDSSNITNKFRNYFFNVGLKAEIEVSKKLFTELQLSFMINKNNHDKTVKAFRSVFNYDFFYKGGIARGKDRPYNDVNYNGIIFLQGGINYQAYKRFKLHALYSISLTPVNKHTQIKKLYYRGISLQLSYSAW